MPKQPVRHNLKNLGKTKIIKKNSSTITFKSNPFRIPRDLASLGPNSIDTRRPSNKGSYMRRREGSRAAYEPNHSVTSAHSQITSNAYWTSYVASQKCISVPEITRDIAADLDSEEVNVRNESGLLSTEGLQ